MALRWSDDLQTVDWQALSDMYLAAPLGAGRKPPEKLAVVFGNSQVRSFVYDGDQLVGAGRALCDGADVAHLADIALLPTYQARGLGAQIMRKLLEPLQGYGKIILYSVPGKEDFYRRFGFARMTTAMARFADQPLAFARGYVESDGENTHSK